MASIPIKKKYTAELLLELSVYHHDYTAADKHISLFEPIWFIGLNGNRVNITLAGSFTYTFDEITYNLTVTPLNAERVINIPLTYTKGEFNFDVGSTTHKYIFNYKPGSLYYEYWIDDWTVDPNRTSSWDGYDGWIIQLNQTPNWSTNTVITINCPFVVEVEEIGMLTIKDIKYGSYTGDITMRPLIVRRPDPLYNNYYRFFLIDTFDMQYQITDGDQTFVNTVNSFHTGQNVTYKNTNLQRTNSINLVSSEMYTGVNPYDGKPFYTNIEGSGYFYIDFIEREIIQLLSSTNFRRTLVTNSYEINGNILNHKKFTLVQEGPKNSDGIYNWNEVSRTETIDAYIQLSENWVLRLNIDEIRKYQQGLYNSGLTDTDMTDYVLFRSILLSYYANSYSGSNHIKALYKGSDLLYEYNG